MSVDYSCQLTLEQLQRRSQILVATHQIMRPPSPSLGRPRLDVWTEIKIKQRPGIGVLVLYNDAIAVPRALESLRLAHYLHSETGAILIPLKARQVYLTGGRLDLGVRESFASLVRAEAALPSLMQNPLQITFLTPALGVNPAQFKSKLTLDTYFDSIKEKDRRAAVNELLWSLIRAPGADSLESLIQEVRELPPTDLISQVGDTLEILLTNQRRILIDFQY